MATLVGSNFSRLRLLVQSVWTFMDLCFTKLDSYFTVYVTLPATWRTRFLLVRIFSGLPPCVGYLVLVRGIV